MFVDVKSICAIKLSLIILLENIKYTQVTVENVFLYYHCCLLLYSELGFGGCFMTLMIQDWWEESLKHILKWFLKDFS